MKFKTLKRLLSLGLSFAMTVTSVSISFAAEDTTAESMNVSTAIDTVESAAAAYAESSADIIDSGTCGDNLTWTLDSDGTLTISGTRDMYDYDFLSYVQNPAPWGEYNEKIKKLNVLESVISLGECVAQQGWYTHNLFP